MAEAVLTDAVVVVVAIFVMTAAALLYWP